MLLSKYKSLFLKLIFIKIVPNESKKITIARFHVDKLYEIKKNFVVRWSASEISTITNIIKNRKTLKLTEYIKSVRHF
jgi:hypothetical protein